MEERNKDVIHSAGEYKMKKALPIVDPELLLGFTFIKKKVMGITGQKSQKGANMIQRSFW